MTIVTTQRTGKDAKILLLLSKLMFWGGLVGVFAFASSPESTELVTSSIAFALSIPVYILGRIVKWWKYS